MITYSEIVATVCALTFGICLALCSLKIKPRPLRVGLKCLLPLLPLASLIYAIINAAENAALLFCGTLINIISCVLIAIIGFGLIRPRQLYNILTENGQMLKSDDYDNDLNMLIKSCDGDTPWDYEVLTQKGLYKAPVLISYCFFWIVLTVSLLFLIFSKTSILMDIPIVVTLALISAVILRHGTVPDIFHLLSFSTFIH